MVEQMLNCMGETNAQIDTESIVQTIKAVPDLYVEVDNDNNFTRMYFVSEASGGDITITTDLSFSYPINVNVPAPLEYKDFSEVISEIFKTMYITAD